MVTAGQPEGEKENPDVTMTTSPELWATFLAVKRAERNRLAQTLQISGTPERVKEFLHTLGAREEKHSQLTTSVSKL